MAAKNTPAKTDAVELPEIDGADEVVDFNVNDLGVTRTATDAMKPLHEMVDKAVAEAVAQREAGEESPVSAARLVKEMTDEQAAKYRSKLSSSVARHDGWGLSMRKDNRIGAATYGRWVWQITVKSNRGRKPAAAE